MAPRRSGTTPASPTGDPAGGQPVRVSVRDQLPLTGEHAHVGERRVRVSLRPVGGDPASRVRRGGRMKTLIYSAGTVARSQGLRVVWYDEFSVEEPMANSSRLVLPSITTWSSHTWRTAVAVYTGM